MKEKYQQMVLDHQQRVYSMALRIVGDRAEAEDVIQEVYLKLWQHIETVEVGRADRWLLRVTRNACLDRLRARRLTQNIDKVVNEDDGGGNEPMKNLAYEQLGSWLRSAIEGLKEPYKSLIILRDIHQHSHRHVAETLSLTENQVKVYLHRARLKLREKLQEVEL